MPVVSFIRPDRSRGFLFGWKMYLAINGGTNPVSYKLKYLFFILLAFALAGCATQGIVDTTPVLVTKNDMVLTRADYEAATMIIPKAKRAQITPNQKQVMLFLENTMIFRTLAGEAREQGIDKDLITRKELQQAVDKVLGMKRLEAFEASLKKPDFTAAAREQYEVKKAQYAIAEGVNAAHVLIKLEGRADADARKLAEEVHKKALAGENFSDLAVKYSDDPSKAQNKGVLGMFERGQMVKPFETAAFALNSPGDISPVVKTQFGYHVIRLVEKRSAVQQPFEIVKEKLMQELDDKFVSDARASYISAIKNDPGIVIHEEAIEALHKQ